MSTINMVKFFFLQGLMPTNEADLHRVVTLAYQTARENKLFPKETLIRSAGHLTTTIDGKIVPDPLGHHFNFCYKDEEQVRKGTHIACHGYTPNAKDYTLTKATIDSEKPDNTIKKRTQKFVWPGIASLQKGPEIGYNHQ